MLLVQITHDAILGAITNWKIRAVGIKYSAILVFLFSIPTITKFFAVMHNLEVPIFERTHYKFWQRST